MDAASAEALIWASRTDTPYLIRHDEVKEKRNEDSLLLKVILP